VVEYFSMRKKSGKIIVPPGAFIDVHEKIAADYLALNLLYDIEFLIPTRHKGIKTPDILMAGNVWEIKSPTGKSARTIENTLRAALRQSPYIVLDLRRMDGRVPAHKHINETVRRFKDAKSMKRLIIITRQGEHIDLVRR
jgi:hypothetical protein